jgi:nucleotide-binding universal stress UspA family protein
MVVVAALDDTDGATTVLGEAQALAADLGEDLHAVHVIRRSELVEVLEKSVDGQSFSENYEVQQVGENIVARAVDPSGPSPTVSVRIGDPGNEVVAEAEERDARYVVVGGRQHSPTGKALFGSVAQKVILESPIPVLSVSVG